MREIDGAPPRNDDLDESELNNAACPSYSSRYVVDDWCRRLVAEVRRRRRAAPPLPEGELAPTPGEQCPAVLPNDRRLQFNDGWLCCALRAGHSAPHRTVYNEPSRCEGDPAWTFDVAAIKALPSPYRDPVSRAAAPAPGVVLSEEQRRAIGIARDHMLGDVTDLAEPERWAGILDRLLGQPSPRPATLTVGECLADPRVCAGSHVVRYRFDGEWIEVRGTKGWSLVWRKVYRDGGASSWQHNMGASDLHERGEVVPFVKDPLPSSETP